MIMVDNQGSFSNVWWPFNETEWNGLSSADCVFPTFLFLVGVTTAIANGKTADELARNPGMRVPWPVWRRLLARFAKLFLIGAFLNLWAADFDFHTFSIFGVLQRISLCFLIVSTIFLLVPPGRQWTVELGDLRLVFPFDWLRRLLVAAIVFLYVILMYGVDVPGCGRGNLTHDCNAGGYIDTKVFGEGRMPSSGTLSEGIVSTFTSVGTTYLGLEFGLMMRWKGAGFFASCVSSARGTPADRDPSTQADAARAPLLAGDAALPDARGSLQRPATSTSTSPGGSTTTSAMSSASTLLSTPLSRRPGLLAANWFAASSVLVVAGVILWAASGPLDGAEASIPINKKIWTPSFMLLVAGISGLLLAVCACIVDVLDCTRPQAGESDGPDGTLTNASATRIWTVRLIQWARAPFIWLGRNPAVVFIGMVAFEIVLLDSVKLDDGANGRVSLWEYIYEHGFATWMGDNQFTSSFIGLLHLALWVAVSGVLHHFQIFVVL